MAQTRETLRKLFQSEFDLGCWQNFLVDFLSGDKSKLKMLAKPQPLPDSSPKEKGVYLGEFMTPDGVKVGLFSFDITGSSVLRKKIGLRNLVRNYLKYDGDAVLVTFREKGTSLWRFSFISDMRGASTAPRRYTYVFGDSSQQYRTPVERFIKLQTERSSGTVTFAMMKDAFSVEALSKQFYSELFDWYQWAISEKTGVTFPNDVANLLDNRKHIEEHLIRLITRFMFVWFIKQKRLVPDELFDAKKLKTDILKDFDPDSAKSGNYYNAILQNLFFATLNNEIDKRAFATNERNGRNIAEDFGIKTLYRNPKNDTWFKISNDEVIKMFSTVPFLNGGLFECLDKETPDSNGKIVYADGFSREPSNHKRAFIPNNLFFDEENGLISILSRYNFTIEENSANDAEVALDPELLGKVFENLLGAYNPETRETARNQSGSFYTPREIVGYMVDESLRAHLKDMAPENVLDALFADDDLPEVIKANKEFCRAVAQKLKAVKILDPACGSGAFPMGVLNRMVSLLQKLNTEHETVHDQKLHLIENCIYGIDIQTIAVQISKLRFFISLVCEEEPNDDKENNYGISPLPNLETKFVAANSLIGFEKRFSSFISCDDEQLMTMRNELLEVRHNHFAAKNSAQKKRYRKEDAKLRGKMKNRLLQIATHVNTEKIEFYKEAIEKAKKERLLVQDEKMVSLSKKPEFDLFGVVPGTEGNDQLDLMIDENKAKRDKIDADIRRFQKQIDLENSKYVKTDFTNEAEMLVRWNPYDQNTSSVFFDAEWMFGEKEGFDIVIGNPPYIQLQNNGGELAKLYEGCGYQTFARTGDIYCLFYERGQQLLKQGGHLCYITSNKWMRAGYGEKTRAFFAQETNPLLLIDFAGVKIFESATVDTNILLFSKSENLHKTRCAVTNKQNKDSVKNLSVFVRQQGTDCDFNSSDSWVILSPIEQSIKRKIEAVGTPLKDWDIQINYGIKTGFNDAFIVTTEKRNEILENCQTDDERTRTADLIRPILRGRDIKRYSYDWAGLWLIATFPSRHYNIEEYPAVKKHLLSFGKERLEQTGKTYTINGEAIKSRKKTNNKWFEVQDSISYWEDFNKPKIVWAELSRTGNSFCLDYEKKVIGNTGYILCVPENRASELPYLVAILNSRTVLYMLDQVCTRFDDNGWRWLRQFVEQLYIPKYFKGEKLCSCVKSMTSSNKVEMSEEINSHIFELFHLSEEEKDYINNRLAGY